MSKDWREVTKVRVSAVIDLDGTAIAVEIERGDDVYFVSPSGRWDSVHLGPFPNRAGGVPLERELLIEIEETGLGKEPEK